MSYADTNRIPFTVIAGSEEIKQNQLTLKNMISGKQEIVSPSLLVEKLNAVNH
jgi:histidyl-tRNA synthetase